MTLRASLLFAIAATLATLPTASVATPLDNLEAALLSQNPATDYDVISMEDIFGSPLSTALAYNSHTTTGGWTSTITGNYLGQSVNITYSGDLSGYPGVPITWTSIGAVGVDSWSGSGTLAFSGDASSFPIEMASTVQLGSHTVVDSALLSGNSSPGQVQLTTISSTEILDGVPLLALELNVPMQDISPFNEVCSLDSNRKDKQIENEWQQVGGDVFAGTISPVPEPASIVLVLTAFASFAVARPRKLFKYPGSKTRL